MKCYKNSTNIKHFRQKWKNFRSR